MIKWDFDTARKPIGGGTYEREEEEEEEGVGPWVQVLVELIKSRVLLLAVVNNGIDEVNCSSQESWLQRERLVVASTHSEKTDKL